MKFSINYQGTPFLETSRVNSTVNRLNHRCEILLTRNRHAIGNKNILDIASHDGTFTYACLQLGAKYVVGVEPRSHLVHYAIKNLTSLGHETSAFTFIEDDIFNYLPRVETGQFDTILCFGFFYHTTRQTELLAQVSRIKPRYFILDTCVERFEIPKSELLGLRRWESQAVAGYLVFYCENPARDVATIQPTGLAATPTKSLVEALLSDYGFKFRQLNWGTGDIDNWYGITDYKDQTRVSYLAEIDPTPRNQSR